MDIKEKSTKLIADSITGMFTGMLIKVFVLLKMEKSAKQALDEYTEKVNGHVNDPGVNNPGVNDPRIYDPNNVKQEPEEKNG